MSLPVLVSIAGTCTVLAAGYLFLPWAPQLPVLSAGDPPRLILLGLGAGWSLLGTIQSLRLGRGGMKKTLVALLCAATLAVAGGTAFWVLDYSYRLPPPVAVKVLEPVKAFSGADQSGVTVSDTTLRGRAYALVFTRGFW